MAYSVLSGGGKPAKPMIIVADDDAQVRKVAARLVQVLGYDVLEAGNGFEAVESYKSNRDNVSALLLDVRMPIMDGVQAFEELKRVNPKVRVLFYSGDTGRARADELLKAGAVQFIDKPFNLDTLSKALSKAVNG
ncbi:MAG: response regulator [Deltaproteobacteria bacterium]|nr:response regulator [Deltaproteobacteria bacterium]